MCIVRKDELNWSMPLLRYFALKQWVFVPICSCMAHSWEDLELSPNKKKLLLISVLEKENRKCVILTHGGLETTMRCVARYNVNKAVWLLTIPPSFRWLVFSDPGFQGMVAVLEEGAYPFPETWGFPSPFVGSLKPLKMVRITVQHRMHLCLSFHPFNLGMKFYNNDKKVHI